MLSWAINQVPPWIWIVIAVAAVLTAFYFLSPILIPLWRITPKPIKVALGFVVSIIFAVLYGRHKGSKDEQEMQKAREAKAVETRRKVDASVKNASDSELDKRASRWMRD